MNYRITQAQCGHTVAYGNEATMRKALSLMERRGPGYVLSECSTNEEHADAACESCR